MLLSRLLLAAIQIINKTIQESREAHAYFNHAFPYVEARHGNLMKNTKHFKMEKATIRLKRKRPTIFNMQTKLSYNQKFTILDVYINN